MWNPNNLCIFRIAGVLEVAKNIQRAMDKIAATSYFLTQTPIEIMDMHTENHVGFCFGQRFYPSDMEGMFRVIVVDKKGEHYTIKTNHLKDLPFTITEPLSVLLEGRENALSPFGTCEGNKFSLEARYGGYHSKIHYSLSRANRYSEATTSDSLDELVEIAQATPSFTYEIRMIATCYQTNNGEVWNNNGFLHTIITGGQTFHPVEPRPVTWSSLDRE